MEYNGFEAVLSVPRKYPEVDVWFAMIGAASVGPLFSISGSNCLPRYYAVGDKTS